MNSASQKIPPDLGGLQALFGTVFEPQHILRNLRSLRSRTQTRPGDVGHVLHRAIAV